MLALASAPEILVTIGMAVLVVAILCYALRTS